MPPGDVQSAAAADQVDFGENYAQELRDKRALLAASPGMSPLSWHFIGPLQRNKVKYVAGQVAVIHSVDSADLLVEIDRRVAAIAPGTVQDCLLQVNVAGESQKKGLPAAQIPVLLDQCASLSHVRCTGLMVIPPLSEDAEATRPHFAALRRLRDEHAARTRPNVALIELSMGMSQDLEIAIAEGATMVRVGTAIFGARSP